MDGTMEYASDEHADYLPKSLRRISWESSASMRSEASIAGEASSNRTKDKDSRRDRVDDTNLIHLRMTDEQSAPVDDASVDSFVEGTTSAGRRPSVTFDEESIASTARMKDKNSRRASVDDTNPIFLTMNDGPVISFRKASSSPMHTESSRRNGSSDRALPVARVENVSSAKEGPPIISFGTASNLRSGSIIHRAESLDVNTSGREVKPAIALKSNRPMSLEDCESTVSTQSLTTIGNSTASGSSGSSSSGSTFHYRLTPLRTTTKTIPEQRSNLEPIPDSYNDTTRRLIRRVSWRDINEQCQSDTQPSDATSALPHTQSVIEKNTSKSKTNRLTKISAMYDLDGDGQLDEAEQVMRNCDVTGRGHLTNDEIKKIVERHLEARKEVHNYKRVVAGLICLVCILALSNFGTSWASAILAKDVAADTESSTIKSKYSGEVVGFQEVSYTIELESLTDEEFEERRRLVDAEIAEDPDHEDHLHRRLGRKQDNKCQCSKIGYDHGKLKERDLKELIRKCDGSNTVSLQRKWLNQNGNYDIDIDTICGPGTMVVKKGKRKRNKKKNKVRVIQEQVKFRRKMDDVKGGHVIEVSFHCENGDCYGSGATLLQQEGHPCDLSRDHNGASECDEGLVCYDPDGDRYGTGTCIRLVQNARKNQVCDLNYGVDACESGYGCYSASIKRSRAVVGLVNTGTCQRLAQRVRNQDVCDASYGSNACDDGYTCIGEHGRELNGWGVGYCQRLVQKQRSGGLCDLSFGRDACDEGYYCRDTMLVRGGGGNWASGYEDYGMTNAIISGPSGTIAGSDNSARGNIEARSVGTGLCTRAVGRGGMCKSNVECGWNGTCIGLGADTATGGVIRGASGTIVWGTGGSNTGICG